MLLLSVLAIFLASSLHSCGGHGRLMDPPSRNSMWRLGFPNPVNYNDNELYCGGRVTQWARNKGRCGVCGDPYHLDRPHELGGKYANGIISRDYYEGDVINLVIHITANHQGYFEFRICPMKNPSKEVTQECLDKNLLHVFDQESRGVRYNLEKGKSNQFFNYSVKLPEGLTCEHCVMQWKYRTGNTWDKDPDGKYCVGCGPQEEFYNCADVSITKTGKPSQNIGKGNAQTFKANVGQAEISSKRGQDGKSTKQMDRGASSGNRNTKRLGDVKNKSPYISLKNVKEKLPEKKKYIELKDNKSQDGGVPYSIFWDPSRQKLLLFSKGKSGETDKKSRTSKQRLTNLEKSKQGDFLYKWKLARLRQLGVSNPDSLLKDKQHTTQYSVSNSGSLLKDKQRTTQHRVSKTKNVKTSNAKRLTGSSSNVASKRMTSGSYKNSQSKTGMNSSVTKNNKKSHLHDKLPQWLIKAMRLRNSQQEKHTMSDKPRKSSTSKYENRMTNENAPTKRKPHRITRKRFDEENTKRKNGKTMKKKLHQNSKTTTENDISEQDDQSLIRKIVKLLLQIKFDEKDPESLKDYNDNMSNLKLLNKQVDSILLPSSHKPYSQPSPVPYKQSVQIPHPQTQRPNHNSKKTRQMNNNSNNRNIKSRRFHSLGQNPLNFGERDVEIQPYSNHIFNNDVMRSRDRGSRRRNRGKIVSPNHNILPTTSRLQTSLDPYVRRTLSLKSYSTPKHQNRIKLGRKGKSGKYRSQNARVQQSYQDDKQEWNRYRSPKPIVKYDSGNTNTALPSLLSSGSDWLNYPYNTQTPVPRKAQLVCKSLIQLGGGMDDWCNNNCNANYCPSSTCVCRMEQPKYGIPAATTYSHKRTAAGQNRLVKPRKPHKSRNKSKPFIEHLGHGHNSYFHKRSTLDYATTHNHRYPKRFVLSSYPPLDGDLYYLPSSYSSYGEGSNSIDTRPKDSGFQSYDRIISPEILHSNRYPEHEPDMGEETVAFTDTDSGIDYQNYPERGWDFSYDSFASPGENIWTNQPARTENDANSQRYYHINPTSRLNRGFINTRPRDSGSNSVRADPYSQTRQVTRPSSLSSKHNSYDTRTNNIAWYGADIVNTNTHENNPPNGIKYGDNKRETNYINGLEHSDQGRNIRNPMANSLFSNNNNNNDNNDVTVENNKSCKAIGPYAGLSHFDQWCNDTCLSTMCPLMICKCDQW